MGFVWLSPSYETGRADRIPQFPGRR